jgi:hypothetical protein
MPAVTDFANEAAALSWGFKKLQAVTPRGRIRHASREAGHGRRSEREPNGGDRNLDRLAGRSRHQCARRAERAAQAWLWRVARKGVRRRRLSGLAR